MKFQRYLPFVGIFVIACCVISIGCDEMQDTMIDVTETPAPDPPEEPGVSDDPDWNLPEIALSAELEPGRYIVRNPIVSSTGSKLTYISKVIEDLPNRVRVYIKLDPQPWLHTVDAERIIGTSMVDGESVRDTVVVEITKKRGVRNNEWSRFTDTYHDYVGIAVKNLTQPGHIFEYEIDPANPDVVVASDRTSIVTELEHLVFETAQEAIDNENIPRVFRLISQWLRLYCGKTQEAGLSPEYRLYFTHRNDRKAFIEYLYSIYPYYLWRLSETVHIFEDTNYFYLHYSLKSSAVELENCLDLVEAEE